MCGITGFTGSPNSEVLERITNCIVHRGPNDVAYIVNSNFSVGYRRLAIIDLQKGLYPIKNESDTLEIVLNGEIYNYQELRQELEAKGHEFKTESDSETIVHGYEEWGRDVVTHLRGMFVFVLQDKNTDELFIARDRLGIKPFYYATSKEGRVIFGSEIKSIFAASVNGDNEFYVHRDANEEVVMKFLLTRVHDDTEETFFKNVKRLPAGHTMTIKKLKGSNKDDNQMDIRIEKYWKPTFNPEFKSRKSDKEYAREFKEIFSEAVKLHLLADVPVGVTLSGGLDSSGITSMAHMLNNKALTLGQSHGESKKAEVIAFSAVHPGETIDESEYIDSVVRFTGIKSVKIKPEVDKFWEELETWIYFQEEPVISGAPYAYYTVMREAAKEVTVLLSGQGGDELLAGYVPYFLTYLQSAKDQKKYWPIIREVFKGKDLYFKYFLQKLASKYRDEEQINPMEMINRELPHRFPAVEYSRNLNERLFEDVTTLTTPGLLRYEDKNSMAHSLESRVPFFDHEVVEYIFNLPIDQKIKHGWNRYIYRQAMENIIPDKNRLRRSKVGFTNPEWEWIERKSDKFMDIFNSESFRSRRFWNADKVLAEFKLALSGQKKGDILFFWRLFIVEMWMRIYVDKFEVKV